MLVHPVEQGSDVGRHAWRSRKSRRIGGGQLVDHKQPCVDLCSVLRIDGAVDRRRKRYLPAFLSRTRLLARPGYPVRSWRQ
jgi:hypothetical protein